MTQDLSKHDFIGSLEFQLHEVVTSRDQTMMKPLLNKNRQPGTSGRIYIHAEEQVATANTEIVIFNPVAALRESGVCFFIVYRNISLGKYTPIYKSEVKRPEGGFFKWN